MKIQEYKSWSELHRIVIVRKISFRKIKKKKKKRDTLIHVFRISRVAMRVHSRLVIRSSKIFQRNIFPFVPMDEAVYFSRQIVDISVDERFRSLKRYSLVQSGPVLPLPSHSRKIASTKRASNLFAASFGSLTFLPLPGH